MLCTASDARTAKCNNISGQSKQRAFLEATGLNGLIFLGLSRGTNIITNVQSAALLCCGNRYISRQLTSASEKSQAEGHARKKRTM